MGGNMSILAAMIDELEDMIKGKDELETSLAFLEHEKLSISRRVQELRESLEEFQQLIDKQKEDIKEWKSMN
jgi:chromosome segregation ATPase